ncbi:putative secreted protein (Por secretion system target) [Winogradskyella eximia]|uniref:Putative secreted protein (Por secretion system target) n=1 Tax=Winogradskyella eximia TaxID=262006 RepID=A0A3D9H146_9FLAO|nr:carboxypeptidase-like regulatory domain-containing protein [Winogradskyella eximia]RED43238.1 putative secreted protein (Por secretion system target) [Winogradskyella eximia]
MKKMTLLFVTLSFTLVTMAQISVSGTVTNDSIPLESASVIIKNSTHGIATNSKGEFKIEAIKGDTLSVSYLGYKPQEFVLTDTEEIEIKLKEDTLNEAVVIAYSGHRCWTTGCGICITYERYWETNLEKNKLFPNPSSNGIFQLKLVEDYAEVKISIANMSGRIIQNSSHQKLGKKVTIDLSQFSTGIYVVNIVTDGKRLEPIKAVKG